MNLALPRAKGAIFAGGMEACWIVSGLWLLEARAAPEALPVPWLMLGLPLAFTLRRLTRTLSPSLRLSTALAGGLIWALLLITLSNPPVVDALMEPAWVAGPVGRLFQRHAAPNPIQFAALAAVATWVGGLRLAAIRVGFDQLLSEFQFGLPILLFIFFCAAQWDVALPAPAAVAFSFFTFSLLGMAAARGGEAGGWLQSETRARWLAAFVFNAALVLGMGLLLTAAITPAALKLALGCLQALWHTMVEWVVRFIMFLARLMPPPVIKSYFMGGNAGSAPQGPSAVADLLQIPDYVRRAAAFIVSAFWVVMFGVCLWRMASQIATWLSRQMNDLEGAKVETLRGGFRQDLQRLLNQVSRRLRRWIAWLRYALGRRPMTDSLPAEAAAVRRLYRRLLSWSAAGGCPRQPHQTPHEFLGRLCDRRPESCAQLTLITEHYAGVRYGGRRPDADLVKLLESTWQDVRRMRKRLGIEEPCSKLQGIFDPKDV
jgi:hypothetical protein